MVAGSSPCR